MRFLWLAVVLAGCGGGISGQDPHELTVCDETHIAETTGRPCELACATIRPTEPISCMAMLDSDVVTCGETFAFGEFRGCCDVPMAVPVGEAVWRFAECLPE